jgi:peroxiredoxin
LSKSRPLSNTPSNSSHAPDSLNEKLAAYRRQSEALRPELARAYDRLVTRLAALDQGTVGPALGQRLPDFVMPDQSGALVSLNSLLSRGPLLISFNRGHWCPYCKLDLRALAAAQPEVERHGGQIVSIMPDTAAGHTEALSGDPLPFPILSDVDLGYALSLGLVYWVGADVITLYRELGIDLERHQGNEFHFLPLTAKFVVSNDGVVKARHVDIEFRQRVELSRFIAAADFRPTHTPPNL